MTVKLEAIEHLPSLGTILKPFAETSVSFTATPALRAVSSCSYQTSSVQSGTDVCKCEAMTSIGKIHKKKKIKMDLSASNKNKKVFTWNLYLLCRKTCNLASRLFFLVYYLQHQRTRVKADQENRLKPAQSPADTPLFQQPFCSRSQCS